MAIIYSYPKVTTPLAHSKYRVKRVIIPLCYKAYNQCQFKTKTHDTILSD